MQQNLTYINTEELMDDEFHIDLKKIAYSIWNRRVFIAKVFMSVLVFFILLTFVLPKKYKVDTDLYINKANNTNMVEVNPYAIEELGAAGGMAAMIGGNNLLANELELIRSPLVIDKVIRENNLIIKKKFGIIPNRKEGEYITAKAFLKKNISIENKKGTNVVTIEYKSKDPEKAYDVVNSIIKNYVAVRKELVSEKSKADKKIIETQYSKAKRDLDNKIKQVGGLPSSSLSGTGNLAAMSAFSSSAQKAISTIQGQYVAGEKSRISVTEDASKVAALSSKLEWATLVEEMSDSSKVLVLKEPQKLRDFEYSSPKLLINLILGLILGFICAIIAFVFKELTDKKLTYSALGENIIYNVKEDFVDLKLQLLSCKDKLISVVLFADLSPETMEQLKSYKNIRFVRADISEEFVDFVSGTDSAILCAEIGITDTKLYKQVKEILDKTGKNIMTEVII